MAKPPMSVWAALAMLAVVVAGAAVTLRAFDELGRAVDAPSQDRTWGSVAELERALGRRLAMPAFYPRSLGWPPSRVRSLGGGPQVVVLGFVAADGGSERLVLAQTLAGRGELPREALPAGVVMDTQPLALGQAPAQLTRLLGEDGSVWYQVTWDSGEQTLALRSRGSVEELLKLADSVRREGP